MEGEAEQDQPQCCKGWYGRTGKSPTRNKRSCGGRYFSTECIERQRRIRVREQQGPPAAEAVRAFVQDRRNLRLLLPLLEVERELLLGVDLAEGEDDGAEGAVVVGKSDGAVGDAAVTQRRGEAAGRREVDGEVGREAKLLLEQARVANAGEDCARDRGNL